MSSGMFNTLLFLLKLFLNPYIIPGFVAAFLASLFWMAPMTKFEISFAYPFMSISFVIVLFLSYILYRETITIRKILGLMFIILGIVITVKL